MRTRASQALGWFYREILVERIWLPLRWLALKLWSPRSFGIEDSTDRMFFVEANKFTIDGKGRLLFWRFGRLVSAVDAGKWARILEGISLEDFSVEE